MSRTAKRLAEKGLIAKAAHGSDRRLVQLALTREGQSLMAELLPLAKAYQAEIEHRLGSAFEGLDAGLDSLLGDDA